MVLSFGAASVISLPSLAAFGKYLPTFYCLLCITLNKSRFSFPEKSFNVFSSFFRISSKKSRQITGDETFATPDFFTAQGRLQNRNRNLALLVDWRQAGGAWWWRVPCCPACLPRNPQIRARRYYRGDTCMPSPGCCFLKMENRQRLVGGACRQ